MVGKRLRSALDNIKAFTKTILKLSVGGSALTKAVRVALIETKQNEQCVQPAQDRCCEVTLDRYWT